MYIYVLELQDNKYYIGKTHNQKFNINYFDDVAWTIRYKPIKLLELIPYSDIDMEKITKKYIDEKTKENVRGGSYFDILIDKKNLDEKEFNALRGCVRFVIQGDKCFRCFNNDHYEEDCKKEIFDNKLTEVIKVLLDENRCYKCFEVGHMAWGCVKYD